MNKVVINNCYGGFGLSPKACDYDGRERIETPDSQDWVIIEGA